MSEPNKNIDNEKLVGYICAGPHSRASNLEMDDRQRFILDHAMDKLKQAITNIFPKWTTLEISIKEIEEDGDHA